MPSADRGRLWAWLALVGVLAALNYAGRFTEGNDRGLSPLYTYSAVIGGLVELALILGIVLWIARGRPLREYLALRRPSSWGRAAGMSVLVLVAVFAFGAILEPLLEPGKEQGLVPEHWHSEHAVAFFLNFAIVVLATPVVEELTFRGLGFTLLSRYGEIAAILLVGLLFGLAHGLVEGLPVLAVFGAGLAWIRAKTGSVFPGMIVHGGFNALVLTLAVTG